MVEHSLMVLVLGSTTIQEILHSFYVWKFRLYYLHQLTLKFIDEIGIVLEVIWEKATRLMDELPILLEIYKDGMQITGTFAPMEELDLILHNKSVIFSKTSYFSKEVSAIYFVWHYAMYECDGTLSTLLTRRMINSSTASIWFMISERSVLCHFLKKFLAGQRREHLAETLEVVLFLDIYYNVAPYTLFMYF